MVPIFQNCSKVIKYRSTFENAIDPLLENQAKAFTQKTAVATYHVMQKTATRLAKIHIEQTKWYVLNVIKSEFVEFESSFFLRRTRALSS